MWNLQLILIVCCTGAHCTWRKVTTTVHNIIVCCTGAHYTWRKVTTTVHNIIVGKLWVDQHGDMDIVNHKEGVKCHLKYIPYSYFTRDIQRKVRQTLTVQPLHMRCTAHGKADTYHTATSQDVYSAR